MLTSVQQEVVVSKYLFFGFLNWFCITSVYASTFVDNGGTIYEAELRVALKHTRSSLREVDFVEENELAACESGMQGKFCQYLDSLSRKEKKIVRKVLVKYSDEMRKKIRNLKVTLTGEAIRHQRSHGTWRKVQAGANPKDNSMIINQDDFVSLSPAERVMLLVHELGHLVKIDGRYIKDDERVGGMIGRELLDAMGASVALVGLESGDIPFESESIDSKAYKDHWLSYQVGTLKLNQDAEKNNLNPDGLTLYSFSYRLQFLSFGLNLAHEASQKSDYSSGFTKDTSIKRYKLGASYKLHPFYKRADFWGHTHILLQAGLAYNQYKHSIKDNYVTRQSEGDTLAPYGELSLFFPLVRGFWVTGTVGTVLEKMEDESTRIMLDQPSTYSSLGVSYGF